MIHRPRLIILDEPTVGVDSLLRHKIWQYLENLCQTNGQTVIITTHYIEEARSAAQVAFMNSGTILKQSAPNQLMLEYQCSTLEEVFLKLCQQHKHNYQNNNLSDIQNSCQDMCKINVNSMNNCLTNTVISVNTGVVDVRRVKAMLMKYLIFIKRQPLFIFAYYIISIISLIGFNLIIGGELNNMPVALYNNDEQPQQLSRMFIDSIDDQRIKLNEYPDLESAVNSVRNGRNYLALQFRQNFSDAFETRVTDAFDATNEDVEESLIHLYMDNSNHMITTFSGKYLIMGYNKFLQQLGHSLNKTNLYKLATPVQVNEVIYGNLQALYSDFSTLGAPIVLATIFTLSMVLSAFLLINAKSNNQLERIFVAGVKPDEYFIAHIAVNVLISIGQLAMLIMIMFILFNINHNGKLIEICILLLMQNFVGISIGLLLALIGDRASVMALMTTLILPLLMISGTIWPLEAVPHYLRLVSHVCPITEPIISIRNLLARGWHFSRPEVFMGYIVSGVYIIVINFANIILFRNLS